MIRPAKMKDAAQILELVNGYATEGLMLPKAPYDVYRNIQNFFVVEKDEKIIGCARLSIASKDLAEVASLAVLKDQNKLGIGRKLVEACLERAKYLGLEKVFTLTYQCAFFEKCGFEKIKRDDLPHKVFGECLNCPKAECCDENAYIISLKD